jgi:hypothetical protein
VAPVVLATKLLKVLLEEGTHGDDAVSHILDFTEPLLVESRVVENGGSDTGTVDRRVGVERAHENLDLRINAFLLVCRLAHNGEGTDTLAVKTLKQKSVLYTLSLIVYIILTMFFAKD